MYIRNKVISRNGKSPVTGRGRNLNSVPKQLSLYYG